MIAELIGVLTITIAIWTWRTDKRRWMKALGIAALGTIIAQGTLGGLTVIYFLPPLVSSAHAAVGQTFFCIACCIALFTGREWVEDSQTLGSEAARPRLLSLALLSLLALYVQLVFGALFRHHGLSWVPHVVNAPLVAIILTWTAVTALTRYGSVPAIRRPAIAILFLVTVQLCLGFLAFLTRVEWGRDAAQPELPMIASTVAHVAVGALLLAATYILTFQVWRLLPTESTVHAAADRRETVIA